MNFERRDLVKQKDNFDSLDSRAWVELNINNLKENVEAFQSIMPNGCRLMPAVKADAYGHGAAIVTQRLQQFGVTDFCVATVQEGMELRQNGVDADILVLSYTPPGELDELIAGNLIQTVLDADYANMLKDYGKKIRVHIGIDTGMHRVGERFERIEEILNIWNIKNVHIEGVFSHLCVADSSLPEYINYTKNQIDKFNKTIYLLHKEGKKNFTTHLQSSYGILNYPECHYDYARLGIALYGVLSSNGDKTKVELPLKPVLSLKSRIACIKQLNEGERAGYGLAFLAEKGSRIAVVSIGYADGVPRNLSGKGYVLCHGKKATIVGRICMDQLLVDVSDIPEAAFNDEIVLIGGEGNEKIAAETFADWSGTITNEVLSRLGKRLDRKVYA
jgi:alanine racemase